MRVLAEPGRRDPHPAEGLERAPLDLGVGEVRLVLLERLAEVVGDSQQRIQPRHRLLEDQPELRAAHPTHRLRWHRDEIPSVVEHLTVGTGAVGKQPENAATER